MLHSTTTHYHINLTSKIIKTTTTMATTGKVEVEVEVKSSPEKIWTALRESDKVFPQAFPDQYKSIEVVEGDGISVGSIRLIKFVDGNPLLTTSKEKIEAVDEVNKTVSYSVIDGDLTSLYKSFKAQTVVAPKGDGSLVKWECDYEKTNEEAPNPDIFKEFAVKTFEGLDAFLLKA